jgi:uncharacterized membrane protein YGL010W
MVSSLPRLPRWVLILFALCFLAACTVHVLDLWRHGWLPYHFAPLPLNAYWTALTFLDAFAAVLLLWQPRIGLALAVLIITSDVVLNLFAQFYLRLHLRSAALSLQLLFFVAVLATTFYARKQQTI